MLVYDQILKRVENYKEYKENYKNAESKPLIEHFEINNLQSVSYDISMGNRIMKFKDEFKVIHLDRKDEVDELFEEVEVLNYYNLRPGEYVLVRINEKLNMPNDLSAHIRPRTTFNKLGLIITSQHINPSYSGHLQIGIKNETPNLMVLRPGLVIGQVVFEKVDGIIKSEDLYENRRDSKYQNEDDFVGSKVYKESSLKKAEEIICGIIDKL